MPSQPFTPTSFQTFGDLLKYLRRRAQLTQIELSIIVGYSEAQIGRLEKNQRRPDLTALQALFIPALHIENEHELSARFLELAQAARQEDAPAPGFAPYKGLLFFEESDSDLFFGREALTARLADRVIDLTVGASTRFLAVVGASGSGKSSLVRAGLAVTLKKRGWDVRVFTPGANPIKALETQLYMDQAKAERDRVLILVDQFEEVFTLCRDESERLAFIQKLFIHAQNASYKTTVVIALRADFYSHCAQYPHLRQAVATEQEYIGQMRTEELRRAIEEPARRGGWEFEPGLVDVLLNDIGAQGSQEPEPGALPLLSHALLATWERRRGRTFTLDGYYASGGVRSAIAETAESVFTDQLNRTQQNLARDVFLRLTELGEGTEDTRRRAGLNELVRQSEEALQLRAVLNTLAESRLITLNEDSAEVAHEALIREWQRLREWLNEDRDGLKLHRHLTETAREWESHGRDRSELYRGARLAHAREWITVHGDRLNPSERNFLAASIEQEQHDALEREAQHQRELIAAQKLAETERQSSSRLRVRNRVIMVVGSMTLILAIMTGLFGIQSNRNAQQAQKNLILAEQQRNAALNAQATADASFIRAESQRLAVEAINLLKNNVSPELIALLSLRSMNMQYSPQGDAALAGAAGLNYPRQIFTGHTDAIINLAFSPDGKYIVTSSRDQTTRLWDVPTGEQLQQFDYRPAAIYHTEDILVKFSPDGRYVFTTRNTDAYYASIGLLWNIKTGEKIRDLFDNAGIVAAVFSQDRKHLITGSQGGIIRTWEIQTGEELRQSHLPSQFILYLSSSGKYAITKSENDPRAMQLWDIEKEPITKIQEFVYSADVSGVPQSVAISSDDHYALIGYVDGSVILWDISTGKSIQIFMGLSTEVRSVAFSPDGTYVIAGGLDKIAQVWNLQTVDKILSLTNSASIYAVVFSPDGSSVLTGSADGIVQLWDVHPRPALPIFTDGPNKTGLSAVVYSPDGKFLATGGANGLQVWEVDTARLQRTFRDFGFINYGVKISPDGLYLLSGDWSSGVTSLWDVRTGEKLREFTSSIYSGGLALNISLNDVAFSPDGRFIAASPEGTYIRVWDKQSTNLPNLLLIVDPRPGITPPEIVRLAFSPDGKYVMSASAAGEVKLSDIQTGTLVKKLTGKTGLNGAAFSPDGRYIATASVDKLAHLWDVESGKEIRQFSGHTDILYSVSFSPDGKTIATTSADGTARLWDVQTGKELRRFTGHTAGVKNVAFSPDGKFIATVSDDGTARLWDVDYHATMRYLCSILLRDFTDAERIQYNIRDHTPTCPP